MLVLFPVCRGAWRSMLGVFFICASSRNPCWWIEKSCLQGIIYVGVFSGGAMSRLRYSSWPRNIIWMNYRTRTGHGSDHLAMLEDAMKMAWNKHAHTHALGRCVGTTNIDLETLLQRSFLCQSAFHPTSFLKPNLDLVIIVPSLRISQALANPNIIKSILAGATCLRHPC